MVSHVLANTCSLREESHLFRSRRPSPDTDRAIRLATHTVRDIGRLPLTGSEVARHLGVQVLDISLVPRLDGVATLLPYDAVSVYSAKTRRTRIFIDHRRHNRTPGRLNWSVAHEVGHIVLGHLRQINPPFSTPLELAAMDREADVFAAELLMPAPVVLAKGWSWWQVADKCMVSEAAAKRRVRELQAGSWPVDEKDRSLVYLWGRQPVRPYPGWDEDPLLPGRPGVTPLWLRQAMRDFEIEEEERRHLMVAAQGMT